LFPNLNLDWNLPSLITNAQIDIDNSYFKKDRCTRVLTELSEMNCECIEIRSFSIIKPSIINHMLEVTQDSRIKELRFILHFDKEIEQLFQEELICQHSRINSITFHNSKINDTKKIKGVNIFYLEDKLDSSKCGQVCSSAFTINIENFTESINFNNCLNRKVAIDSNGNIKNCGSQEESFGNVNELSLTEAINNSRFQKLWHVRKDDIEVCKDCEFRYICTDCRIFKNDSNDIYSKPKKCNYDPYTNTWA
jgi:SPASM domain peptide maturase of grasp-with-spasm system